MQQLVVLKRDAICDRMHKELQLVNIHPKHFLFLLILSDWREKWFSLSKQTKNLNLFWQEIDEVSRWTPQLFVVHLNMNYISKFYDNGILGFLFREVTGTFWLRHAC